MNEYRKAQLEAAQARKRALLGKKIQHRREQLPRVFDFDPLHGVVFATELAEDEARKLALTHGSFSRSVRSPSSAGGYTKKDVVLISKEKSDASTR